jgi:hypothetical protein
MGSRALTARGATEQACSHDETRQPSHVTHYSPNLAVPLHARARMHPPTHTHPHTHTHTHEHACLLCRFPDHVQPNLPHNEPPGWGVDSAENTPEGMKVKIDAATQHGIDIFLFDW